MTGTLENNLSRIGLVFLCAVLCATFAIYLIEPAYAQGVTGAIQGCSSYVVNNRIFTPIALCLTDVVNAASQTYIQDMVSMLGDIVVTLMAIAIALLGFKIATGASQAPAAESFLLIIKMTVVSYLVMQTQITFFLDLLLDFMAGLTEVFTTVLEFDDGYSVQGGDVMNPDDPSNPIAASVTPPGGVDIWHRIDYLFQRILGLSGPDTGLQEGMIGIAMLLAGLINLGPVGGWLGVIAFFAIGTMIGAFGMIIFSFMSSLIAVMILGAFSPIVLPLILFDQTRNIFEKWLSQVLSYSLQPVILTAFLMFMLSVMENSGAIDMVTKYVDLQRSATGPNSKTTMTLFSGFETQRKSNFDGVEERDSANDEAYVFLNGQGPIAETTKSSSAGVTRVSVDGPSIDVDSQDTNEFGINLLLTIFLAYIMLSFVQELPNLVVELIGDRSVPNLIRKFGTPVYGSAMKAQEGVANYLRQ